MRTVPQTATARKPRFESLEEMTAWQAALDYANDMARHTPPAPLAAHYADATGRTLLGHRETADAQHADDEAAGGLVWLAMNRGR